jgi:hypothetical protein
LNQLDLKELSKHFIPFIKNSLLLEAFNHIKLQKHPKYLKVDKDNLLDEKEPIQEKLKLILYQAHIKNQYG